jgi:hypothetical protein
MPKPAACEYPYQVRWPTILLGLFSVVVLTGAFAYIAVTNDRGLIVGHVLDFSTRSATLLYAFFCLLGAATTALCCRITYLRFTTTQRLVLTELALQMPRARWSSALTTMNYAHIKSVKLRELNAKRYLDVRGDDGETCSIASAMLPSDAAFAEICQLLRAHGKQARI